MNILKSSDEPEISFVIVVIRIFSFILLIIKGIFLACLPTAITAGFLTQYFNNNDIGNLAAIVIFQVIPLLIFILSWIYLAFLFLFRKKSSNLKKKYSGIIAVSVITYAISCYFLW